MVDYVVADRILLVPRVYKWGPLGKVSLTKLQRMLVVLLEICGPKTLSELRSCTETFIA